MAEALEQMGRAQQQQQQQQQAQKLARFAADYAQVGRQAAASSVCGSLVLYDCIVAMLLGVILREMQNAECARSCSCGEGPCRRLQGNACMVYMY
jgi:hypothetical protein